MNAGAAHLSDTLWWIALSLYIAATIAHFFSLSRPSASMKIPGAVAAAGAVANLGAILARAVAAGRVPWGNMFEYSTVLAFLLVSAYLIFVFRRPALRTVGAFAMLLAVVTLSLARGLYVRPSPLVPALNSWWLKIHVISAITASSIFSLGFVFTVLYLLKSRAERRVSAFVGSTVDAPEAGFPVDHIDDEMPATEERAVGGLMGKLPKAAVLDSWAYRSIAVAFPIWTWAVIAGAVWASKAWGRYWGWDPKETWAFITWVIYAAYLHSRATSGWRGRGAAIISAAGFVSLWITYYVVNLWIVGLHSYKNG